MPYAEREFTCSCGVKFWRRAPASATPSCVRCAIKRSVDNSRQLHEKSGPYFDAWAAAMAKAIPRIAGGVEAARRTASPAPGGAGQTSPTSPSPG